MDSSEWLKYFRQNTLDRVPISWHDGVRVCRHVRGPLARSLARFQLGESSDGARLRAAARRLANHTGDRDYAEAIGLFIGEEQEHARLLAEVLSRMHAPLLSRHWSDWLFRRCRHLLGFYQEISVLLMAEIVALKYYSIVRCGADDGVIEKVCDQILYDEKFHVRFHCEYLHRALAKRSNWFCRCCWCGLTEMFACASAVVACDHRRAFAMLGSSSEEFLRESWLNFAAARRSIFTGEAFVWSATTGAIESPVEPAVSRAQPRAPSWVAAVLTRHLSSHKRPTLLRGNL
jgi:hypothetical protein